MAGLSIAISFYWEERPGDCSQCKVCNEEIYLKKYIGILHAGAKKEELQGGLCEACYNLMEDG